MDQSTRSQIIESLKKCTKEGEETGNFDDSHEEADKILCDLLISLGYKDIVEEYLKVPKWYF